jgi:hypothetical protein
MKRILIISSLLFAVTAFVGVSCAAVNVPAATTRIDKAITQPGVAVNANPNGAIISFCKAPEFFGGTYVSIYSIDKIYWCADEEFYSRGYKAKLSNAVDEIFAPPTKKYFKHRYSRNC